MGLDCSRGGVADAPAEEIGALSLLAACFTFAKPGASTLIFCYALVGKIGSVIFSVRLNIKDKV